MKVRNDFVSNSSSCSFVFRLRDNLIDELKGFPKLLSNLDFIDFDWDLHDDAKEAYKALMENEAVRKAQETHDWKLIEYGDDPNRIRIIPTVLTIPGCKDPILDAMKSADTVELFIMETWDSKATMLVELMTYLDIKGYKPDPSFENDEHLGFMSLKDIEK